jgi:hypothetical protein
MNKQDRINAIDSAAGPVRSGGSGIAPGSRLNVSLRAIPAPAKITGKVLGAFGVCGLLFFVAGTGSASVTQKWTGSRTTPVHQIPLKDESDQLIVPTESHPFPFSARTTCAPCHDYDTIKGGLHFTATSQPKPGRPGEPWVWVDERTGTQIPLSFRPAPGVWNPAVLGLTNWDFTLLFGRHFPGGGVAEPPDAEMTPGSRWEVSGKAEINCLGCHNAGRVQNESEWAKQIMRENFRWAATAAAGLGEVGGMASRLRPTWDLFDGPNPDDSEWAVAPFVKYNRTLFDSKHRAFLDIAHRPDDARCLACHAVGPSGAKKFDFDADVHTAAGIACADCHRNDLGHGMIRGYEGEKADDPALPSENFTCRACHLGEGPKKARIAPGRLGAPYPRHKGIPEVHFERLSCTVCHSGPLPAEEPARVRTSRANRLGIFGVADWSTDFPAIQEPVEIRDRNGLLTPHRLMWPAFWAKTGPDGLFPLKPETVQAAASNVLFPEKAVTRILSALLGVPDLPGIPVLELDGRIYDVTVDGGVKVVGERKAATGGLPFTMNDGKLRALLPDFDPANAETSPEPEARVQQVLEALAATEAAPGKPAVVYKGFLYRIVDATLEKSERKEEISPLPRFVWLKDGAALPFVPAFERRTVAALTGKEETLTEEQVQLVLTALGPADHAYIASGRLFRLNDKGVLVSRTDDAARPAAWPMAHEVRPARQSLGVNGCTDCHSAGSDFFFARVEAPGPLRTDSGVVRSAVSFMRFSKSYHKLFGLSFTGRPYFKLGLLACAVLLASILLIVFLTALGRFAGLTGKRS